MGPAGGTVTSADGKARLEIPAGALAAPTKISIAPVSAAPERGFEPGGLYDFAREGLVFAVPARLSITCEAPDRGVIAAELVRSPAGIVFLPVYVRP